MSSTVGSMQCVHKVCLGLDSWHTCYKEDWTIYLTPCKTNKHTKPKQKIHIKYISWGVVTETLIWEKIRFYVINQVENRCPKILYMCICVCLLLHITDGINKTAIIYNNTNVKVVCSRCFIEIISFFVQVSTPMFFYVVFFFSFFFYPAMFRHKPSKSHVMSSTPIYFWVMEILTPLNNSHSNHNDPHFPVANI